MNTLPKEFEDVRESLSKIPNINRGGCAIAALAMYRVGLRLGMDIKIVYFYDYDCDSDYRQNSTILVLGEGYSTNCNHAGILVDNHYIDVKSMMLNHIYPYYHVLPEPFVIKTLREGSWNPEFEREKWLPFIERIVGEKLLN